MDTILIYFVVLFMYIISGIDKIFNFNKAVGGFRKRLISKLSISRNLPSIFFKLSIVIAIVIELLGSLVILYSSYKENYTHLDILATYSLLFFTVLATLIYHFPPFGTTYYPFISNVTSCGALLLIIKHINEHM